MSIHTEQVNKELNVNFALSDEEIEYIKYMLRLDEAEEESNEPLNLGNSTALGRHVLARLRILIEN